ncbi:hypothetical protein ACFV3R_25605 [Streptomyces sp. NPDC059740]|uniref:hypothetical protein n=1 Tax=Streptomyces sp. NPDC059740 TaxID=3346926 RepID=UPI0036615747
MAITIAAPHVETGDWTSEAECLLLLSHTGHKVARSTLRRWLSAAGVPSRRMRGAVYYPWTSVVQVHRDQTVRRLRRAGGL